MQIPGFKQRLAELPDKKKTKHFHKIFELRILGNFIGISIISLI